MLKAEFFDGRSTELVDRWQRFRRSVFVERLHWDLWTEGDREVDAFDRADTVHCTLCEGGEVRAGFRATRTDRPYLAAQVFPRLASTVPYPRRPDIWEISRFGVLGEGDTREVAKTNYALMFRFAALMRATSLVAIADPTYERFLRANGIRTRRYGPPCEAAHDRAGRPFRLVAGDIPMASQDPARLAALAQKLDTLEICDVSEIFGPSRVSA